MKEVTAGDRASLDDLDRQWGHLYDIAISNRKWVPQSCAPAAPAPGRSRITPSGRKWVAQRFGRRRWLTADNGDELAALIAADFLESLAFNPGPKAMKHAR